MARSFQTMYRSDSERHTKGVADNHEGHQQNGIALEVVPVEIQVNEPVSTGCVQGECPHY
jgi:hypothetical protein